MSSMSPHWQVAASATTIYSCIVAAVTMTTIALCLVISCKLWKTQIKFRDKGILIPAQASTTPRRQPVDYSVGDEGQLDISVPPQTPPIESQFINQDARDEEPNSDISIPAQPSTTAQSRPIDDSAGDEGQLSISVLSPAPPTTSEPQFRVIDQHAKDKNILLPAQASANATTSRPHEDIGSEEVPSITLSQGSSNFQISKTNATIIRNGDGEFTKVQRDLSCEYIANLHIAWPDTNGNLKKHALSIITLLCAEAVSNNYQNIKNSGSCFKGTRVALLREMADCVTGSSESRMYILSGLADTGKSTVAYTIASRAADLNLLGASFVFSRDETNHSNAQSFFTTIAYQLCVYSETFAKAIEDTWEAKDKYGFRKYHQDDLQFVIQQVILDSLRSIVQSRSRPTLIVVDALDECDEEDAFSVLTGLSQFVQCLPSFKVILTTRPDPYLDRILTSQGGHTFFHLQDIENKVVDGDIRLYINHCLSLEQVQIRFPNRQWCASDEEINSLVCSAGRFFIIASTAVRYILDKTASNPAAQMQKLLHVAAGDHTPLKDLDRFYTVILRDVVPEDCDDDVTISRYRSVVGTIIFVQHSLSVSTLAHLIGIDVEEIHAVLDKLQSVILLGDDDVPCVYHKSFPEYLMDQLRCKDPHLRIDPRICHTQIVTRCFEIMNTRLKRNIMGFGNLARFMSNEDGLKKNGITDEQLQEKIPLQLRYACTYWIKHLEVGNIEDAALMNGVEKFVNEHMLYWFEVLSLIGKLGLAYHAINGVLTLLVQLAFTRNIKQKEAIQNSSSDLHQLLLDAILFIENFYEIIERSALHTYHSLLLFTPTDSLLYCRYNKEIAQSHPICAIDGGPEKWNISVATRLWHDGEKCDQIRFSLDSAMLVSCSIDRRKPQGRLLNIWDVATSVCICGFIGDALAVANDFSIVSAEIAEDKTITLYDANGLSPSGTMFTTSKIQELALSSESSRVATALSDGTIWLWNSGNFELIDSFDGFKDSENWSLFQFSPTGTRLAYSSVNGIVKLRDGISGRSIADLQCESCVSFEFSDDGSRIISLSNDCDLTLWDSKSGGLLSRVPPFFVRDCQHVAISADGSLVATAGEYVRLWNLRGILTKIMDICCKTSTMAFSLNNILAIATDDDVELYNVTPDFFSILRLPFGGPGVPTALAFSPDCTRLAVGGANGIVELFDIRRINTSGPPQNQVTALALSRDCSRLACGFEDGTVELWGTSPTKARIASHRTHKTSVRALGFGPDGGLFASGSDDGIIMLWNGKDGSLREVPGGFVTLMVEVVKWVEEDWMLMTTEATEAREAVETVALSNDLLVAAGNGGVALWSLDTLSPIHTFTKFSYERATVSIAENNALIAVAHSHGVSLFDAENHRTVGTFCVLDEIHTMTFLPGNLQLVAQSNDGAFLSFNLINKLITRGVTPKHLIQLPNISRWHDIPVWYCRDEELHYLAALFPQHKSPVPVLWIPTNLIVMKWTQESSMIALHCDDGRIILVRLPTTHVS